jgi:hypothetical protein
MLGDFPSDVKQFIDQHIESLAQLEVLLLLHERAERQVHPGEIARRLAIMPEMSATILADLARRGFAVRKDELYRFQSPDGNAEQLINKLAETYRDRRVAVTSAIYSKPIDKVKTFAEAFRLRKEK